MSRLLTILFYVFLGMTNTLNSQSDFAEIERVLSYHADIMVNASRPSHREKAEAQFRADFETVLLSPGSYAYPFDSLIWISKMRASDNSFRVFSWQLNAGLDEVNYAGFIQLQNGKLFRLTDNRKMFADLAYEFFTADNWYGQMYYNLLSLEQDGDTQYILFGYKQLDAYTKQKIATVIDIRDESITFGKESFFKSSRHGQNRVFIEYAKMTNAILNYDDELEMIVYDHLTPMINPYQNNKMMFVPDGSYEAYYYEEGKWRYKERILDEIYDKAPVPEPILKNRSRDIMGKED